MKKSKKKPISDDEINLKTREGRFILVFVLVFIVAFLIAISKNTRSFYDWYPGRGFDEWRFGTKQDFFDEWNKKHAIVTNDTIVTYHRIDLKDLPFFLYRTSEDDTSSSVVVIKKEWQTTP